MVMRIRFLMPKVGFGDILSRKSTLLALICALQDPLLITAFSYSSNLVVSAVAMFKLLSVVSLLAGSVLSISDELATELGYPTGVDVWQVKSKAGF